VYAPDKSAFVWKIKQLGGSREFLMRAHFGLPSVKASEFISLEHDSQMPKHQSQPRNMNVNRLLLSNLRFRTSQSPESK